MNNETHTLNRKIFSEQSLGAPNDTLIDDAGQLDELLVAEFLIGVRSRTITAADNRNLEAFSELGRRAQNTAVDEVYEREVLEQVILNRCSRQQNSPFRLQFI